MIETLINWCRFDIQNFIGEVWWVSLILWIVLALVGISDIATNTLTMTTKVAWTLTVLLLPMAGLFAYCIFCLTRVEYHWLEFLTMRRTSHRRKNSGSVVASR